MGWFTRTIKDPEEVFSRLSQKDKKISEKAKNEFISCLNSDYINFLVNKFEITENTEIRLNILEIFAQRNNILNEDDLRKILTLIKYPETLFRETFKEILSAINNDNLRAVTEYLAKTSDVEIHKTIQYGIEKSGIIDSLLEQWNKFSVKDQILYIGEIILFQSPKTFPIFLDIMKEESSEEKKEEKKLLQMEFCKHVEKIKNPEFVEVCVNYMSAISPSVRYPVFKCLQKHGDLFFSKLFENFSKKQENYKLNVLQIIEQLSDPLSYPYLFKFLLDPSKTIPPIVSNTISKIVKTFCEELDSLSKFQLEDEKTINRSKFYSNPLEENLTERFFQHIKTFTENLLRLGKYFPEITLRNFAKLYKYNENYLKSYLKGLTLEERKTLLINACCYKDNEETGLAAIKLLSDPSENYIVETLNTLLLEHFMNVPTNLQGEIINIMMDPRLQRFVNEVLYHQNPELRSRILWILGESGFQDVLQIIETKLRDPDYIVRENILKILDLPHFKNDASTELLLKLLKDSDSRIIIQTIDILKKRDNQVIISNLSKLLSSKDNEIRINAHKAIAFITKRKYLAGFYKMNNDTKLAIGTSLIKMDPTFLEEVSKDLSDSDQSVRILSAQVIKLLCEFIPPELKTNLIVASTDPDPNVRAVVIMALGKIGGPSVANLLVSFLKDQDDRVRANAVEAMQLIGDKSLINDIVPCLYDKNNRVRGNAIMTLWKLGYYQVYEAITTMLKNNDKWMRASAVYALGELRDTRFFALLLSVLRDKDADVRRNVVLALSKLAPPFTLAPYIRPLRFDPDEKVRKEVMAVLTFKAAAPK